MDPTLTKPGQRDERRQLRAYSETRDPRLLEALVLRFRPLARSLAMRYRGGNEPLDDLIQVADLGLVKAIQGFDPTRESPFTSYAIPTILGEVKRHFRDKVWNLRLPRALQESGAKVVEAREQLTIRLGREPSVEQLAEFMDLDHDRVAETLVAVDARRIHSLDAPRGADPEAPAIIDQVGAEDRGFERVESDCAANEADLDPRERLILQLSFGRGVTQADIGEQLGISQMQVSRVARKGLQKLLGAVRGEAVAV